MPSHTHPPFVRLMLSLLPLAALIAVMGLASVSGRNSALSVSDEYHPFAPDRVVSTAPATLNHLRRTLLEQQYRHVAVCRAHLAAANTPRERQAQAFQLRYSIVQYNQAADESDPSMFQTTPLPPHMPAHSP